MARTRLVNGEPVPFTAEEEAARDAEEAEEAIRIPVKTASEYEVLRDALVSKALITQADLDASKTKLTK